MRGRQTVPIVRILSRSPAMVTLPASLASLTSRLSSEGFSSKTLLLQTINWGHSDIFQHVNNVHYVRFFESSRMSWLENVADRLGDEKRKSDLIKGHGVGMILAGINVTYRRPVTYPDSLLIGVKLKEPMLKGAHQFTLHGAAYSLKAWETYQAKVDQGEKDARQPGPACVADQLCVTYDYDVLRKAAVPEDLRLAMNESGNVQKQ